MNKKIGVCFLAATVMFALLGLLSPLGAQGPGGGNIKLGPLEVHPFMGVTETYNDNFYRNYGNLKSE
ncbi:MAG: hypothetical protein V2B13_14110, partial [Pseudomonadota bacterium]